MNGFFDIFESVIEENIFVEDCSCLTSSGLPVETDADGNPIIVYTDADGVEHNYPGNYGLTTCMAWDLDLPPTCADSDGMPLVDAPDFCGQNWCYVSETCLQGAIDSTYFPDQGLKYSYDVCA